MKTLNDWNRLAHAPAAELRERQDRLLARYVREELYPFSAHYRRVFDEAGVDPRSIRRVDDLRRLPFTTQKDLLDAQSDPERKRDFVLIPTPGAIRSHWGFGRKLALVLGGARAREALRYHYTPNFITFTTGRSSDPVIFSYTPHDLDILSEGGARMLSVHEITDTQARILNLFPFAPHLAFWQATLAGFRTGRLMVPTGGGKVMGTSGNLRLLERLRPTVLIGTPGFVYHLLRTGREQDLDTSAVKLVILGAEKVPPGLKQKMAEVLEAGGASDVMISGTYGFTEARMAFSECPAPYDASPGYTTYPDLGLFECIDPKTGDPVGEGETGELVYTTLSGHGTCVMRYRTGDLAIGGITWQPCPYTGRTVPRISSELRRVSEQKSMSLTKVKGTLVDLSHIGTVVANDPAVEEWQVVLEKRGGDEFGLDELVLRVALAKGTDETKFKSEITRKIADATEVAPNRVEVMKLSELLEALGMETEMKEKRFLDLRPKT